ncbi:MAG: DUF402 domain-containing protein [Lachnospiraceae bacterium]|nr:DUF402 domain-containing protein [Lachnospiraceae bacterium]
MPHPVLYRKRIIPDECVELKDDIILSYDKERIITKWNALKPKKDLHHGYSCYFLKEGYKISKFYREDNSLMYHYCDIITHEFLPEENKLIVTDLLADVIIYPDGFVKVVDLDEMVPALDCGGISLEHLKCALLSCSQLLEIIYSGKLQELTKYIEAFED